MSKEYRCEFRAPKKLDSVKGPVDVRKYCEVFKMTAVDEKDMVFLAHLYRTIFIHGGTVSIDDGQVEQTYKFGK